MKKLIMTVAVLACGASVVSAQVTSANIVGYNKAVTVTGYQILATQFDTGNNTPEGVFGSGLPINSKIYVFNGAGYEIATYTEGVPFLGIPDAWDASLAIGQSVGYWVEIPSGTYTNVISGEVDLADSVTNSIDMGFQIVAYPYPVERTVTTLGFSPTINDKIYVWNGAGFDIATYTEGVPFLGIPDAWDNDLVVPVGAGFWYEAQATQSWVAVRPFTP